MFSGTNLPPWLLALSMVALALSCASALIILIDILRGRPQKMEVMNAVWPITAMYLGPLAIWAYWSFGRANRTGEGTERKQTVSKPFWQMVFAGVCHCGAGCTLGDFAGEWLVFLSGITIASSVLWADFAVDFICAYLLGIIFQYFAIAPMRHLSGWPAIKAAMKADTVSLIAFEIGMFAWMWFANVAVFRPRVEPTSSVYWFSMQIAMVVGFATAFPANWWLIRNGWKEKM